MGQMDFISSIFVEIFFFKIIWAAFHLSHVTDGSAVTQW